jgi:hypothetical protein
MILADKIGKIHPLSFQSVREERSHDKGARGQGQSRQSPKTTNYLSCGNSFSNSAGFRNPGWSFAFSRTSLTRAGRIGEALLPNLLRTLSQHGGQFLIT